MTYESDCSSEAHAAAVPIAGRYEVLDEIERPGGLAGYVVRHVLLESTLVLTAVPADVAGDRQRLAGVRAAVRAASALRHELIVPVLDLCEDDGRYFVVEPFVDGMPLDRVTVAAPLETREALHVARQVTDALAYAHAAGVAHGTVSPANVLVEAGSPRRAYLSGFALFALLAVGTLPVRVLRYTAPERLGGEPPDPCGDVFAVGTLLFEMFEGRPFFQGNRAEVESLLRDATTPFLPRFSRIVPPGLAGLVARAIRRVTAEREREMARIRADVDGCLGSIAQRERGAPAAAPAPAARPARPVLRPAPQGRPRTRRPRPAAAPLDAGASLPASRLSSADVVERPPADPAAADAAWWMSSLRRPPREARFPARILVRASAPRSLLGTKLLVVAASVVVLRGLLLFAMPASPPAAIETATSVSGFPESPGSPAPASSIASTDADVEPVEPVVGTERPPSAGTPTEPAPTPLEPPRIEAHEPARERIIVEPRARRSRSHAHR